MDANAVPLLNVFERTIRLEVPLFQRSYVWEKTTQWEPLWEDVSRKFSQQLEGESDAPPHFLGALVLEAKQTPITHVEKRQVIDGQQRLTTFQIFLAAFRDCAKGEGCEDLGAQCEKFLVNTGMMSDSRVEQFKVWPTQLDREQFSDVILLRSRSEIERKYPLNKRRYQHHPDPRPRMIEAYLYFFDQLARFFKGDGTEPVLKAEIPLPARMEACFLALRSSLRVVVIELDRGDDPQVIFETLNARGVPLLPADLMRNYIFLRVAREGDNQEELYNLYWRQFEDKFWTEPIEKGARPLSDLYMQYFVSSRRCVDVSVKHLYVEYKYWIEKEHPFARARNELEAFARQGQDFRRLAAPSSGDFLRPLAAFLRTFDLGTAYPFLLALLDQRPHDDDLGRIASIIESFLVRRSVCGLSTKNYNRVFLQMTRALRGSAITETSVKGYLSASSGPSVEWPTDEAFRRSWLEVPAYYNMGSLRTCFVLKRLNDTFLDKRSEEIEIVSPLTVEHILPQDWLEHWSLPDGSTGLKEWEADSAPEDDVRAAATLLRNRVLQTMGNLTVLTKPLNSSVSNREWSMKKGELLRASLLPINQPLGAVGNWNEDAIASRGQELFERAKTLWPRPSPGPS